MMLSIKGCQSTPNVTGLAFSVIQVYKHLVVNVSQPLVTIEDTVVGVYTINPGRRGCFILQQMEPADLVPDQDCWFTKALLSAEGKYDTGGAPEALGQRRRKVSNSS